MAGTEKILVGLMILMTMVYSKNNYSATHHIYVTQRASCGQRYQKNGGIPGTSTRGMGWPLSFFICNIGTIIIVNSQEGCRGSVGRSSKGN